MRFLTASGLAMALVISGCQTPESTLSGKSELASIDDTPVDQTVVSSIDPQEPANSADEAAINTANDTSDETITASTNKASTGAFTGNVVESYVAPAKGTVFTWRNNWNSLPPKISLKVAGSEKFGDTTYIKFTSLGGLKKGTTAYYSTRDFSLKGYRDSKNKALISYNPVEKRYRFPMKAGDQWVTSWKSKDYKENKITKGGGVVKVVAFEDLKLKAGKFRTVKIQMPLQPDAPRGMKHFIWFSPELGITVKEEIGGGQMVWTQILEKVYRPG